MGIRINKILQIMYAIVVIHVVWLIAALIINKAILPNPIDVYKYFPNLIDDKIFLHVYFSLYRLFWSLLISSIIGFIVGLLMAKSKIIGSILSPIVYLTYPIPKIALLPVIMLLFGLGEGSKIILLTIIIVFQIIISVRDSVISIPSQLYDSFKVIHASKWQLFINITFPASVSALITTLRVALGTAIAILFFTEVYGTEYGLGYLIMDSWNRLNYLEMYSVIIVLSIVSFILFLVLESLDKKTSKWKK
ncbi:ABC transporter permease [Companilactobacillus sp. DQM5]|uniref:ABC transporter permease n=1 Tax=Companilactobacillus sp. DQM5 TaxID=3463359 RepID=UPI0040599691